MMSREGQGRVVLNDIRRARVLELDSRWSVSNGGELKTE